MLGKQATRRTNKHEMGNKRITQRRRQRRRSDCAREGVYGRA